MAPIRKGDGTGLGAEGYSEVRKGDGTVLWNAIPDSVGHLYEFEDDSDTVVAIDSVENNDLNLNGPVYDTDSKVGSLALFHDGTDDYSESQSSVDLVSDKGDTAASLAGWVKASEQTRSNAQTAFWWGSGTEDGLRVLELDGTWQAQAFVGLDQIGTLDSGVSVSTTAYQHVGAVLTTSALEIWVDGTQSNSTSHSLDITTMGTHPLLTGAFDTSNLRNYLHGLVDDFAPSYQRYQQSDFDDLMARA